MADSGMPDAGVPGTPWWVVVPAKSPWIGKSRLGAGPEWARALLLDTLEAVLASPEVARVVVVTDDADAWGFAPGARIQTVVDPGSGLTHAIEAGLQAVPQRSAPVVIVLGDVPGLRSQEFTDALRAARREGLLAVPDHDGSGTTMTFASSAAAHLPRFGVGSFQKHLDAGYAAMALPHESSLRFDVDTPADLVAAHLGPRTRALLAS